MMFKFLKNKELKNASWIVSGKIFQMILSLLVGVLTARYLGPGNYGLISYASSYITLFTAICTLGINSVIIKDFVDYPNEQGKSIGTTIVLRAISSILSAIMILGIVSFVDYGEAETIIVVFLCSISLVFQIFDTINYWFQSKYQSKITAIATLIAYAVTSIYKIILLILKKNIYWFAFATSVDYICVAIILLVAYKKYGGQKLSFSWKKGKKLLSKGYHYILSGMMVAIYAQTDKLMLKQMLNETAVGYYATATAVCAMWVFVLSAIIDSLYPTIIKLYSDGKKEAFERKNRQLYSIVFYVSVIVSLCFTLFGDIVIKILYGDAYIGAINPLKIATWYTAFSYLGVARNAWIVCENKQKYLKYIYGCAALLNVVLNFVLIPILGASGAALASLITQIFTSIILPLMLKPLRHNAKLMIEAILLKNTFR